MNSFENVYHSMSKEERLSNDALKTKISSHMHFINLEKFDRLFKINRCSELHIFLYKFDDAGYDSFFVCDVSHS